QAKRGAIYAVGNSEAIAAGKYYFKAGSAGSDLLFGFEQCKSYRLILLQPLPPAIKGIRLNAVLLAERGHALPARFLLTYQLVPIVPPGLPHIFKCGTSGDELGRAVHEPLTAIGVFRLPPLWQAPGHNPAQLARWSASGN